MAGLVPAIHVFDPSSAKDVDARDTSAFTRVCGALCAGMTIQSDLHPALVQAALAEGIASTA
jgi:hypothetical protein